VVLGYTGAAVAMPVETGLAITPGQSLGRALRSLAVSQPNSINPSGLYAHCRCWK